MFDDFSITTIITIYTLKVVRDVPCQLKEIKQDYYSSSYGDTGYLFLLVDINDPDKPVISIRTWQPDRNPNINSMLSKDDPDYGIFGIGNF